MQMHLTYDATTDMAYLQLRSTGPGDVIGPALILEHDRAFHGVVMDRVLDAASGFRRFRIYAYEWESGY